LSDILFFPRCPAVFAEALLRRGENARGRCVLGGGGFVEKWEILRTFAKNEGNETTNIY
jgi:hypothetical protein